MIPDPIHSSHLYATMVWPGAIARCFSLNITVIKSSVGLLTKVASCGSCLYLIFADIFVGSVYDFLIRCRPVAVMVVPKSSLSSFSPTTTIFFFTSVLMTYALKGSSSPCLCPIVKKYAHSCLPTTFHFISTISPSFFGSFLSRKSLIGMFPIKHNHWLSLRAALGSHIFLANALISGLVYHQIGNNDLESWNWLSPARKYDWSLL